MGAHEADCRAVILQNEEGWACATGLETSLGPLSTRDARRDEERGRLLHTVVGEKIC